MPTIASILRDGEDPSMPALRRWLQNLEASVAATLTGLRVFKSVADLNAYVPAGTEPIYAFVADGTTFKGYRHDTAWTEDDSFYEGVAAIAQPILDQAQAAVDEVQNFANQLTAGAAILDPADYELWARAERAVRLVVTSDDYLVLLDSMAIGDGVGPMPNSGETLADIMARPGPLIASRDVASVGDSFGEQQLAEETAKAYDILKGNPPGTTKAYNLGYSSHTSHAVATRVNALAANYKPVGGVIPAGTGVFELIAENSELRAGPVQVFSGGSEGGRAPAYYGRQEIEFFYEGGVPKAQRKAPGAAIEVNDFIPLVCIPYAKNITPATAIDDWRDKTVVISCGRNNVNGFSAARLVADDTVAIKAIIDAVRPWGRRIALTPIWPNRAPGTGIDEPYGSDQRAKVDAINANRLAMWREYYCDTLTPAINGYDTAAGDRVDDFNKGYTARSYRLKYDADGVTVLEDYLHAGNYVTPGRKSGQQLEGQLAAQFLIAGHS